MVANYICIMPVHSPSTLPISVGGLFMNFASAVSSLDETCRKQMHYLIVMIEILASICSFTVQYNYNGYPDQTWLSDPRICPFFFWGGEHLLEKVVPVL